MAVQGLSGLDAAFLAAETPANPLHVMAAMVLDRAATPLSASATTWARGSGWCRASTVG